MESIKTISELNTEKKNWETPILRTNDNTNTESGAYAFSPESAHNGTSINGTMS